MAVQFKNGDLYLLLHRDMTPCKNKLYMHCTFILFINQYMIILHLLGMSVTTGKFFPHIDSSIVAGAPRANGTGQVVFFSKNRSGGEKFSVDLILKGDRFASSYGYSLASADFNNDK